MGKEAFAVGGDSKGSGVGLEGGGKRSGERWWWLSRGKEGKERK